MELKNYQINNGMMALVGAVNYDGNVIMNGCLKHAAVLGNGQARGMLVLLKEHLKPYMTAITDVLGDEDMPASEKEKAMDTAIDIKINKIKW